MGSGAAGRAAIGHRRPAMRAAGCFAHIGERYAWQRRRAMTPAPNPARPVLGRGTRRCGRGRQAGPAQRRFVASHRALTSNIVPTVGARGSPVLPHLNWPGKSARRLAPAGRAPETPVPRPVWRRCGNWLQGGFAPARHAPPRPLLAAAGAAPAARVAAVPHPAAAGAQRLLPPARGVAGALTGAVPGLHRRREDGQERGLRLPDVRPVRAAGHRVCLPDDLPQAAAQRSLRRGRQRRFLRGPPGPAVRVAGGLGACGGRRAGRRPAAAAAPRRPPGLGTELVGQLLAGARRRPVGPRRSAPGPALAPGGRERR